MKNNELPIRIGHGYDLHRLIEGRKLILGGVEIPFHLGLLGHSDADCLTHALADSILGALALPDIGHYFPDTDEKNKNIDSKIILRKAINEGLDRSCMARRERFGSVMVLDLFKCIMYWLGDHNRTSFLNNCT